MRRGEATRVHLRSFELAAAAAIGALAVVVVLVGSMVPRAGGVEVLAAVPFGVLAHRERLRALAAATVAAATVAFLVGGAGSAVSTIACAVLGGAAGLIRRSGRGVPTTLGCGLFLGAVAGAAVDLLLALFASSRRVMLTSTRATLDGFSVVLGHLPGGSAPASLLHRFGISLAGWWAAYVTLAAVIAVCAGMVVIWVLLGVVLRRLGEVLPERRLDTADAVHDGDPPGPVPVELSGVRFRYPGGNADALVDLTLELLPGEFVAVVGPNGSGKSTLAALLAGRPPSEGRVSRPGGVGLGRPGGTAVIMQRPESQVLGARVADDVVWGLTRPGEVDVVALLREVGLADMAERETATLSGGELQRLALAAALARRPALLISDESTAMVDAGGRVRLLALFTEIAHHRGIAVVHVTHSEAEAAAADRVVHMAAGRITGITEGRSGGVRGPEAGAGGPMMVDPPRDPPALEPSPLGGAGPRSAAAPGPADRLNPVVTLRRAGFVYAAGTPWERVALDGIDLDILAGDGLLIAGDNGSGKSTLAWLLAGLRRPTRGSVQLAGRPVDEQLGAVGLAFQHARLQLQRPTVAADILDAAGERAVRERGPELLVTSSLAAVGLPKDIASQRIEQLSGGQQRRVAIAGLVARRPRMLVLDEPLAGLDTGSRRDVLALVARLRGEHSIAVVVISHDLEGMASVCDRLVRLESGRLAEERQLGESACAP